ncbi:MAG: tRNA preQ1(34) S-adenosylmethionine ribosyltransferase-isomerase QueA [Clostridiales bacterium]|nr:tRNA preQ1(34) S-adenosylmethionine ribosyltransferase-isomerase QueA [Clostridiales bacterium]
MKTSDFYYDLPEDRIAQHPASPRDSARLLVYDRTTKQTEHHIFRDLPQYLKKGDVLVINNTRVLPARILGKKIDTGACIEFLLHKRRTLTDWEVLARPVKRLKVGTTVCFSDTLSANVLAVKEEGLVEVRFAYIGVFESELAKVGEMPLPPYIKEKLVDGEQYQTVYAKQEGSSAAPTAGLHFTPELLQVVKNMGVEVAEVLLHVGLGTFRPVKVDEITEHKMHSEYYEISAQTCDIINRAKKEGRRVIAVGTTSVRVLESAASEAGILAPTCGETSIFIYPPYTFKIVDALITNFHLPESTLIMLVSAFCGREETLRVYNEAVKSGYRFFSFGDACFFL